MSEVPLPLVAYFSMEYGLHEEFPSYAGGLGVLAGDFMKSAGDLGLPVVGVGLRWAQGYTAQRIGPDGYPIDEWHDHQPTFLTDTGVRVRVRIGSREVACCVWRVSRYAIAPLFLLEPVDARDRWITRRLYDTRPDCRLAQEMLLGIGGVRALRALRLPVSLYHFNEGHAVFAGIELIADRMEAGATFEEAWQAARERIVFTTHTPVPAGNEVHPLADLRRLGASCELVDSEMREIGGDPFNMTVAGLRLARSANAVAQLHGETARAMWAHVDGAAPIIAVTNGVHVGTWQDPRIPPALASDDSLLRVRTDPQAGAPRRGGGAHRRPSRPRRPHDRVRAARRDLQAPRSHSPRPRSPRPAAQGAAGAAHLLRQGASRGSRGQGGDRAADRDDSPVAGQHRVPRELRHGPGPPAHARLPTCGSTRRAGRWRRAAPRA